VLLITFQNTYWPFDDAEQNHHDQNFATKHHQNQNFATQNYRNLNSETPNHPDQNLAATSSLFHPYFRPEVHSSPSEVHPVFARQTSISGFDDFGNGSTDQPESNSGERDQPVSVRQSQFEDSSNRLGSQTANGLTLPSSQTSFEDPAFGSAPQTGYGSPVPVSGQIVKIKILPLPIPVGLPVQVNDSQNV
jgi:hypothetical protein